MRALPGLAGALLLFGCAQNSAQQPPASAATAPMTTVAAMVPPVSAATKVASGTSSAAHGSLTLEGAKQAIGGAVAYAKSKQTTGVIAIVDAGGNLMALERIDDTFAAGATISIGKARTAVLFKKPTRFFEELIKGGRTPMIALNDFTPLQGGIPIQVNGEIVGGIGVSGAASAAQDEELAIAGANAVGQAMVADASPPAPAMASSSS
jgi:glc operon protein GlcG